MTRAIGRSSTDNALEKEREQVACRPNISMHQPTNKMCFHARNLASREVLSTKNNYFHFAVITCITIRLIMPKERRAKLSRDDSKCVNFAEHPLDKTLEKGFREKSATTRNKILKSRLIQGALGEIQTFPAPSTPTHARHHRGEV